ncbi:hypothetical protein GQX74_000404 [Glossina fuscipes]|nr:hypothetical protein GQX74_000404 [Glossina fuscipes]
MEHGTHVHKDYNNVINLSLNGGSNGTNGGNSNTSGSRHNSPNQLSNNNDDEHYQQDIHNNNNSSNNNNNNNNSRDTINLNNGSKSNICNSFTVTGNSFNCDSSGAAMLMNRYLPTSVSTTAPTSASAAVAAMAHQQHACTNSFVAAAAVAAAAAANVTGAPSALQSLQQLHQHHAHQASLNFQREKLKTGSGKKSSIKNKRVRTIFTPEQLERLEAEFERQQYMVGPERLYLAHTLQLTEAQVKVWFQNRRIKWRKHHLELTQQRLALLRQTQLTSNANNSNNGLETVNTSSTALSANCEDSDEIKPGDDIRTLSESRQDSESELSVCNDSMDGDSVLDGEEDG